MRKVRTQRQADFIHCHRAAKLHCQGGVGVAVDTPALVRPSAVGIVFVNAVHGVAGSKYGLAAGFDVGTGMWVKPVAAVAVVGVKREVPPRGDLLGCGDAGAQQMTGARKTARIVVHAVVSGRNGQIQPAFLDIYQCGRHCVLQLHHAVQPRLVALQRDPVAIGVGRSVDKGDMLPCAADRQRVAGRTDNFQFDLCHNSPLLLCQQRCTDDPGAVAECAGCDACVLFRKAVAECHRFNGGAQRL